ncbi:phosphotransferase [Microbacterium sp.]|uniref:phosphotransferase n=1 Tax=Microbacterium sp. TaxID=51671 RepID=UPI0028967F67|nr:phosphotransferase [Microbacterium sp.]
MSNGFARERAAKAAVAAALSGSAHDVASGMWRILDTRSAVLVEKGWGVTAALAHIDRGRGLKRALLDLRRLLAAPRLVRVGGSRSTADPRGATLPVRVLMTKDGGLVGFDRSESTVTHLRRTPLAPQYRGRRAELGEVYGAVEWHLRDDDRLLIEARVPGRPARFWESADRIALLREVLVISTARLRADSVRKTLLDEAHAALDGLSGRSRWDEVAQVADLVGEVPWPIAHGDLTPENILGRGPADWSPIDFEDARPAPFFFDALSLAVRDDEMRAALTGGHLDEEWRELLAAARVDPAVLTPAIALDVVALLAADHHHREHGGDFDYTFASLT